MYINHSTTVSKHMALLRLSKEWQWECDCHIAVTCTIFWIFACSSKLKKISLPDLSGSWDHGTDQTGKFLLADGFYGCLNSCVTRAAPDIRFYWNAKAQEIRFRRFGHWHFLSVPCFHFLRVLRHFGLFNTMQAYQGLLRAIKLQLMVVRTLLGRVVRCCPP